MTSSKVQLRTHMRQQRQALDQQAQLCAANAVSSHVTRLPGWPEASRIALYLANDGEIETSPLEVLCRDEGKHLFLPVIQASSSLEFASWDANITLKENRFGIAEPGPEAERCGASVLDIVFLPLVAWDLQGGRLGMGGGFYDRTLAGVSGPLLVGLAQSVQQVPLVPRDTWDISLDFVVTDTALHCCRVESN
jgi:5-formyltetrahydrofolate cyclo-ligase